MKEWRRRGERPKGEDPLMLALRRVDLGDAAPELRTLAVFDQIPYLAHLFYLLWKAPKSDLQMNLQPFLQTAVNHLPQYARGDGLDQSRADDFGHRMAYLARLCVNQRPSNSGSSVSLDQMIGEPFDSVGEYSPTCQTAWKKSDERPARDQSQRKAPDLRQDTSPLVFASCSRGIGQTLEFHLIAAFSLKHADALAALWTDCFFTEGHIAESCTVEIGKDCGQTDIHHCFLGLGGGRDYWDYSRKLYIHRGNEHWAEPKLFGIRHRFSEVFERPVVAHFRYSERAL